VGVSCVCMCGCGVWYVVRVCGPGSSVYMKIGLVS